jgi:hypothetical protein
MGLEMRLRWIVCDEGRKNLRMWVGYKGGCSINNLSVIGLAGNENVTTDLHAPDRG